MAYVNQEKKAKIALALKSVIPTAWKTSLAVSNHSTITLTIISAPVDLIAVINETNKYGQLVSGHFRINHHYLDNVFKGELLATLEAIRDAMNTDNHDRSDIMTDYFDVGHYINIQVGRWNKPFQFKPSKSAN